MVDRGGGIYLFHPVKLSENEKREKEAFRKEEIGAEIWGRESLKSRKEVSEKKRASGKRNKNIRKCEASATKTNEEKRRLRPQKQPNKTKKDKKKRKF